MGAVQSIDAVAPPRPSISPLRMSVELRRKLGHGVHINLKILLRGDVQTGKSSMMRRLQGLPHAPQIEASRELNVGTLDWQCEGSPDVVRVEAWDVVDADLCRRPRAPLTIKHEASQTPSSPAAPTVDVWRAADASVVLFDPRKRWTFAYALRLLNEAPPHVPILLVANFADCDGSGNGGAYESIGSGGGASAQSVVWPEVEQAAEEEAKRCGRTIVATRASMVDCTGLSTMHAFLQLPYHRAKQAALEAAQREAAARVAHAEATVRALAAGLEPPARPLDSYASSTSAGAPHGLPSQSVQMQHPAMAPEEGPRSPGGGFGGFAPLPGDGVPVGGGMTTPVAPPRIPPPPTSAPSHSTSSQLHAPSAREAGPPASTPGHHAPRGLPGLDADIDEAFFDGLEPPPAAPSFGAGSVGERGASVVGACASTSPARPPPSQKPQEQDDDDREEDDLLPLIDDPDVED